MEEESFSAHSCIKKEMKRERNTCLSKRFEELDASHSDMDTAMIEHAVIGW